MGRFVEESDLDFRRFHETDDRDIFRLQSPTM